MRSIFLIMVFVSLSGSLFSQTTEPLPHGNQAMTPPPGSATPSQTNTDQKKGDWIKNLDLGKLVGAATAPVNLIIAATIAISFLIGKQGALLEKYLVLLEKYRDQPNGHPKSEKFYHDLNMFAQRLRLINWSGRALGITIIIFIGTVTLTSFGVTFPDQTWVKVGTGATLLIGLLTMLIGFTFELIDSCMEIRLIDSSMHEVNSTRESFLKERK